MFTTRNLNELGLITWRLREQIATPEKGDAWQTLQAAVSTCTACGLHQTRTQTVFGAGYREAKIMLIGEAPGFHEDQRGEPFVGRAGQLLNAMLQAIGLSRENVYIANILKCRPPQNRDPAPQEITACSGFLQQQIALVRPVLLVAVGRIAAHQLLKTTASLESLRNQTHCYEEIPLMVTYHPAYLLRNPIDKKKAYQDWCVIKKHICASNPYASKSDTIA